MSKQAICNNCLRSNSGQHPFICPHCREQLRSAGPNCEIRPPSPRTPWWKAGGKQNG
jgi:hypothetical protein